MTEVLNGTTAPAGNSENGTSDAAQNNAATADALTGGADGGNQGQVTPRTYTEEEHREAIERATAKAAAKAERRAFREAAQRLSQQPAQPQQASQQSASDGRPTQRQGEAVDAYLERLTDWKLEQRERAAEQGRQQEQQRSLVKKTESIYADAEKLPGFDRDAFDELPLTKSIVEALVDSDAPAKLMAYMAANPAEVERIAKLSPARQAAEIGKLEVKALAEPVKPSRAPDPITPVGSRSTSSASSLPSDADDMDTWMRKERERMRKR